MVSAPFTLRPRTEADDHRSSWRDLWTALAAETAARNEPDPTIDAALDREQDRLASVAADAGCILIERPTADESTM